VSDQVAMLMDFFPTACEAAGVEVMHEIEARSILPLLQGTAVDFDDRHYYWVRREGGRWRNHDYLGQDYHAVRHGDVKLLHNDPFSPLELYDLAADAAETKDLSASNHPAQANLRRYMQQQVQQAGGVPWQKRS
jgi:arylsulfatase A-like enzyme